MIKEEDWQARYGQPKRKRRRGKWRRRIRRFFTYKTYQRVVLCALLTYACSKCYSFYTGANGIHSVIPLGTPGAILSSGLILVLNICVGFIVTCTMYAFYALFRKGEL